MSLFLFQNLALSASRESTWKCTGLILKVVPYSRIQLSLSHLSKVIPLTNIFTALGCARRVHGLASPSTWWTRNFPHLQTIGRSKPGGPNIITAPMVQASASMSCLPATMEILRPCLSLMSRQCLNIIPTLSWPAQHLPMVVLLGL